MRKVFLFMFIVAISIPGFAAQTPDGNYIVDTDHANIGFSVSHLGFSNVIGRFNRFKGEMTLQAKGDSSVTFEIEAASVDTNQERRDEHIRSDDFFDVSTFPTITFRSTLVSYSEQGEPKTITGPLTLHGETQNVIFEVSPVGAGEFNGEIRAGYVATTKINRSEFGIDLFQGIVGEEITITVNVEIIKI